MGRTVSTLSLTAFLLVAVVSFIACQSPVTTSLKSSATDASVPSAVPTSITTASTAAPDTLPSAQQSTAQVTDPPATGRSDGEGTLENPVPVGTEAQVGPWRVQVLEFTPNADDIVYNHSEFNGPPQAGKQYVLIKLRATRTSEEPAALSTDTYVEFIGSGGAIFDTAYADIPDALVDMGEVDPGGWVAGNLVFEVTSGQIPGGVLRLSEAFSFEGVEVFFAIE